MSNVEIVFNMPDYVSLNQEFILAYTVRNPIDEPIEVYITVYVHGTKLTDRVIVKALSSKQGAIKLAVDKVPFNFILVAEAYLDNTLIGKGRAEVSLGSTPEKKVSLNLPVLIGLGSILWGGLYGRG